jgi:hypothetical protein
MNPRGYRRFLVKKNMAEYFQVPTIKITWTPINDDSFRIKYESERPYVPLLTPEMGRYISSFLKPITIVCVVTYPLDYPFSPPFWVAETRDDGIVERHNKEFQYGWDPTYTADKDVLLVMMHYLKL